MLIRFFSFFFHGGLFLSRDFTLMAVAHLATSCSRSGGRRERNPYLNTSSDSDMIS